MPTKKGERVKKVKIPIFTEEYSIWVEIGGHKGTKDEGFRGRAYNRFPAEHPLIVINGDLSYTTALATLAHEASHAMDYIIEYVGMDDRSGEFRGHGIAAVMRGVGRIMALPPTPKIRNKKK